MVTTTRVGKPSSDLLPLFSLGYFSTISQVPAPSSCILCNWSNLKHCSPPTLANKKRKNYLQFYKACLVIWMVSSLSGTTKENAMGKIISIAVLKGQYLRVSLKVIRETCSNVQRQKKNHRLKANRNVYCSTRYQGTTELSKSHYALRGCSIIS